ncbi:MAG: mercury resistance system transport protein MerF [Candidatus Tectomicrobia bacterium]|nr:mercury resistance system transport protein MerF [Candidatus Tectomicrobia bacterium]
MVAQPKRRTKGFVTAIIGTVLVALCCFTPILVVTLGLVGLSFLTPYLDYILLPALVVMIIVTILSYRKWRQSRASEEASA